MFGSEQNSNFTIIQITATIIVFSIYHATAYHEKDNGLIYILLWTPMRLQNFSMPKLGQEGFMNCSSKNCFLTDNHTYLENITNFDVIMFNVVDLVGLTLPATRSPEQKYCMYGFAPATDHPVPEEFNDFFNITFTYKLTSNIKVPFITIKGENDEVIGPDINIKWSSIKGGSDYIKTKLQNKHIAAAWIVSSCESSWRKANMYAQNLQDALARFGHRLDIYKRCGPMRCPGIQSQVNGTCGKTLCPEYGRIHECLALVESDYYFYLSFEKSFGEDYVTEKLLRGLQHFSVPVVFGNSNYSRFMPEGIYLDASVISATEMARQINKIINNSNKYNEFFKWHDFYSYYSSGAKRYSKAFCSLCYFLNENKNETNILINITKWWNEPDISMPTSPTSTINAEFIEESTIKETLDSPTYANIITKFLKLFVL